MSLVQSRYFVKGIFLFYFLVYGIVVTAKTYYVQDPAYNAKASDSNVGTDINYPWATWDKAFSSRIAGDTVYFRGGVYYSSSSVKHKGSGGTEQNPVCYFAFPDDYINGNFPILDGINKTTPSSGVEIHYNSGYIKLKGLVVRNNKQIQTNYRYAMGFYLFQSINVTFENCVSYSNGWSGFKFQTCNNILLINCDSYDNCDDLTAGYEGGHSDGFIFWDTHGTDLNDTLASVALKGCRAWNNSDDGFDLETEGYIEADSCWSWANGRLKGDGDGFKTGLASIQTLNVRVKITRSISAHNKFNGFDSNDNNHAGRGLHFFNNLSFNNGFAGFWVLNTSSSDIYENKRVYRNNIGLNNKQGNFIAASGAVADNLYNSWNKELGVTVNQSDFVSLDTAQMRYPRKPDGSLPDITFGKLVESSDLIDVGIDVGLPYYGIAPDLGWSEYMSTPATPVYISSVIQNTTPENLEIIYNINLADIIPSSTAFTVKINGVNRTISSVAISGTKVILYLSSPVVYGDVITLAYSKPSINPLQTPAGGQAVSLTAQNVTNNVGAVPPVYVSSVIENATPARLEMIYNVNLANVIPAASAFTVMVNSVARTVSSVSVSGTKVLLTLASPVVYGDVVTVAYTKPATNPLQTSAGGQAVSLTAQNVINNVGPVVPVYISSVIENATPSRLEMVYNVTLANIIPTASAFTVMVNSVVRTVSSVYVSGTKVLLTLASPVAFGDVVTVAYAQPGTNPIQTPSGGEAVSFGAQPVSNKVNPPVPAYVSSVIENAAPARLEVTYDLLLANIIPALSAFTVRVNGTVRTISSIIISGTNVILNLAGAVVYGDLVTVAYTKPATSPLQTPQGGQAITISARNVTNNVAPIVPVYQSSLIESATPSNLEMTFSVNLANIVPDVSAFTVNVNSVNVPVTAVSVSGTKVVLTLASPVVYGDIVTVSYTKPASNPLQTTLGIQADPFTNQPVSNLVGAVSPLYVSSVIENTTPDKLEMTYDLTLANVIPAVSAFTVRVNSVTRAVSSVTISGTRVILTLSGQVYNGDVVTVAYTRPAVNPLQTSSGGQAGSMISQPVVNHVEPQANQAPEIVIFSPGTNSSFTPPAEILIEAFAYDPDGIISKIELFNGSNKIAEDVIDNLYYIWQDVAEGTYILTAVATDDSNAKTTSSAVTVTVLSNQLPLVSISSPVDGAVFETSSVISITSDASDPDGTISKVEYFNGDMKIGESTVAPYLIQLVCSQAGIYEITAKATDDRNAVALSSPVFLYGASYIENPDSVVIYPNPNDGRFSMVLSSSLRAEINNIGIINMTGAMIYNGIMSREEYFRQFDISNAAPGTYILMITWGDKIFSTKKFIKK